MIHEWYHEVILTTHCVRVFYPSVEYLYVVSYLIRVVFCAMNKSGYVFLFFFSSRRRHTRLQGDWSSDVCSSDLHLHAAMRPVRRWPMLGPGHRIRPCWNCTPCRRSTQPWRVRPCAMWPKACSAWMPQPVGTATAACAPRCAA